MIFQDRRNSKSREAPHHESTQVPLMVLPTTSNHFTRYRVAVLDVSLDCEAWIGPVPMDFANVVIVALFVVGIGLSFQAPPHDRS